MSLTLQFPGIPGSYVLESPDNARGSDHYDGIFVSNFSLNVCLVRAGMMGGPRTREFVVKVAGGHDDVLALQKEAALYQTHLHSLQGKHVPRFYGIFSGELAGVWVSCILLEYCSDPVPADYEEMNRAYMVAACALHTAGITHGNLTADPHHFVFSGKTARIVDFSLAILHKCPGATPMLHHGMGCDPKAQSCKELVQLEMGYGIYSGDMIPKARHPLQVLTRRIGVMPWQWAPV